MKLSVYSLVFLAWIDCSAGAEEFPRYVRSSGAQVRDGATSDNDRDLLFSLPDKAHAKEPEKKPSHAHTPDYPKKVTPSPTHEVRKATSADALWWTLCTSGDNLAHNSFIFSSSLPFLLQPTHEVSQTKQWTAWVMLLIAPH